MVKHWCSVVLVKNRAMFIVWLRATADLTGRCFVAMFIFPLGMYGLASCWESPVSKVEHKTSPISPAQLTLIMNTCIHQPTWYLQMEWWMPLMSWIRTEQLRHYLGVIIFSLSVPLGTFFLTWRHGFPCPYSWDLFTPREAARLNRPAVKYFMRYAVRLGAARNSGGLSKSMGSVLSADLGW